MTLTIGIKALNEEAHISRAIKSALVAAEPLSAEVILADSASTDRTVAIASAFPIRILQMINPTDRCCGASAQLAYQHANGDFFYLLDGDMALSPTFLPAAVLFLNENPEVAAVGGRVREVAAQGHEREIRARSFAIGRNWLPGLVERLDGGGLYRCSAIRDVGYFADRNLHAFEEFDLAARLQARGWKLARIDKPAVDHYGHTTQSYALLLRRITSGYFGGAGEVLRAALGHEHLPIVLRQLGHIRNGGIVIVWWFLLLLFPTIPVSTPTKIFVLSILLLGPFLTLSFRRRSFRLGLYSLVAWNVSALGLLTGLFRRRASPLTPVKSVEIERDATQSQGVGVT
jgi:glycosyltransferase involved in cell wall biosynthesis